MLLRFTVENFKSICKSQTFSMIANNKLQTHKDHLIALKVHRKNVNALQIGALFGANASGKSNFIEAIRFAKYVVTKGKVKNQQFKELFCRTKKENEKKPTRFDFEFTIKDVVYAYGFTIDLKKTEIQTEYLYELNPKSQVAIFERDVVSGTCDFNDSFFSKKEERLNVYKEDFAKNSSILFLSEINRNKELSVDSNLHVFKKVYDWFDSYLHIITPSTNPNLTYHYVLSDKTKVENALYAFDTGIKSISLIETSKEELKRKLENYLPSQIDPLELLEKIFDDLNKKRNHNQNNTVVVNFFGAGLYQFHNDNEGEIIIKSFEFNHENSSYCFSLQQESDGTRRIFEFLFILFLNASEQTFFIDEIERSLHPKLVRQFLKEFQKSMQSAKTQLVFTTHESLLLDQNMIRRDEIWFVEKNNHGESSLYSLKNFEERYDKRLQRAYLNGRYGAVPSFKDLNENGEEIGSA